VFELRPYQREALDALDAYWAKAGSGNPLLALATATGKSLLIARLTCNAISKYPHVRILCLVHVQELIEQNVKHLLALWPDAPLGINCAALGHRDWDQQIIFASIQSVFRSSERLGRRHLVLIDECHLVPHDARDAAPGTPAPVGMRVLGDAVPPRQRLSDRRQRQDLRHGRL
jgi:DNA repair protein RadD